jgi:hypothetical protein
VEVVKLVTGHSLTETVLRHYFNPDEQTVFAKMQQAMPQELTQHEGKNAPRGAGSDDQQLEVPPDQ